MKLFSKTIGRPTVTVSSRVVAQKRWLHRSQLTVGMYVEELDKPWSETHFMFQGFRIENEDMLQEVQNACENACVQTEKVVKIASNSSSRFVGSAAR